MTDLNKFIKRSNELFHTGHERKFFEEFILEIEGLYRRVEVLEGATPEPPTPKTTAKKTVKKGSS